MDFFKDGKKIIVYGYGQAFQIVKKILKMNIEFIIDGDRTKRGINNDGIVKHIDDVNNEDFVDKIIFILPFESREIMGILMGKGVKINQCIFLKELLDNEISFKNQYFTILSEYSKGLRMERANKLDYKNIDAEKLFKKWFEQDHLLYRGINLIELLASDISIILDYIYTPLAEVYLYWHPYEESYTIYGEGDILYPMFVRGRNDYYKRLESITAGIKDVKIITYSDVKLDFTKDMPITTYKFVFENKAHYDEISKYFVDQFERFYIKLNATEKKWLDYCIRFYMNCIDFYLDTLKINFKILVSTLPYYGEENIFKQLCNKGDAKSVHYQHGYYPCKKDYTKIYHYIIHFSSKSDYYLLWDEKTKQIFAEDFEIQDSNMHVLGVTPVPEKKQSKRLTNSFVVVCPGKITNDMVVINELIEDAIEISKIFGLSFTIRYHPLNVKFINIDSKLYKGTVSLDNFNVNDYDFAIGTMSSLLFELNEMGLAVYERIIPNWQGNYKTITELIEKIGVFYKKYEMKETLKIIHEEPEKNLYGEFIKKLVEEL